MNELKYALRRALARPGLSIVMIVMLALGLGATTAIFSVFNELLVRPLPVPSPHELVNLAAPGLRSAGARSCSNAGSCDEIFSYPMYRDLAAGQTAFTGIAAHRDFYATVAGDGPARSANGILVSGSYFGVLGLAPAAGRLIDARDEPRLDEGNVTVLSYDYWQSAFGGDPAAVGRVLTVNGQPLTVVGVAPQGFTGTILGFRPQVFVPLTMRWLMEPTRARDEDNRRSYWVYLFARLKPGVTLDQAAASLNVLYGGILENVEVPLNGALSADMLEQFRKGRVEVTPGALGQSEVPDDAGRPLVLLLGITALVLLIVCVNVANLLLARATARERELAVRAAVGGGRARLVRQLITESVLLSAIGAILGVLLAIVTVRWLVSVMPAGIPRVEEISVNGSVLAVTAGIAIVTGLLFGIVPAIRATSPAIAGAATTMGRRSTHGARHHRVAGLLVAAEVSLAVMLVIGAQLLVRSFIELRSVDTGYQTGQIIAARVSPPGGSYTDPARVDALYKTILSRVAAIPGVQRAAAVDKLPIATTVWGIAPRIEGQWEDGSKPLPDVRHFQSITESYLATMGIPLKEGRVIDATDVADATPVAMVSESMAKQFWPNTSAVGKRIGYPWPSPWITIVGVVADVRQDSLRDTLNTSIYVPWQQRSRMSGSEMWVIARTRGEPGALGGTIRQIVREADRTVAVSDVRTMDDIIGRSVQRDRFMLIMIGLFAVAALLLGAVGIYGVMSYLVSQRTQEMGVRIALGASTGSVLAMVVRRGALMAGVGAIVGVVAAFWATKPLAAFLYGVSATDPLTYASVPVAFLLVALLASLVPARRATKVDPVRALRAD
jgi:predicted permease